MSATRYDGSVSVYKNTKNRLVLKADADGQFSNANIDDLWRTLERLSKEHDAEINLFIGRGRAKGDMKLDELCILPPKRQNADPYLALLPAGGARPKPVKLA